MYAKEGGEGEEEEKEKESKEHSLTTEIYNGLHCKGVKYNHTNTLLLSRTPWESLLHLRWK